MRLRRYTLAYWSAPCRSRHAAAFHSRPALDWLRSRTLICCDGRDLVYMLDGRLRKVRRKARESEVVLRKNPGKSTSSDLILSREMLARLSTEKELEARWRINTRRISP